MKWRSPKTGSVCTLDLDGRGLGWVGLGWVGYKSSIAPAKTAKARFAELAWRPEAPLPGWAAGFVVVAAAPPAVDVEVPREVVEVVMDEALEVDVLVGTVEVVEVALLLLKLVVDCADWVKNSLMLVMGLSGGIYGDWMLGLKAMEDDGRSWDALTEEVKTGRVAVPRSSLAGEDATSEETAELAADSVKGMSGLVANAADGKLSGTVAGRAVGIGEERAAMDAKTSVVTLTVAVVVQVLALLWQLFSQ